MTDGDIKKFARSFALPRIRANHSRKAFCRSEFSDPAAVHRTDATGLLSPTLFF
jgi:hypothetical protein